MEIRQVDKKKKIVLKKKKCYKRDFKLWEGGLLMLGLQKLEGIIKVRF